MNLGPGATGWMGDLGTLEAGKLAGRVVLERDPLADICNTAGRPTPDKGDGG